MTEPNLEQPAEIIPAAEPGAPTGGTSNRFIAIAFVAAIVLTAVLVGGLVFVWQNKKFAARVKDFQGQIAVLESMVKDADSQADKSTLKKIYSPNEALYMLADGQNVYDVYLEAEGRLFQLIDNVLAGVAGGMDPEFVKTANAEIIILTVKDADMSWSYQTFYYINLKNRTVTKVQATNADILNLVDSQGKISNMALSIDDTCTKGYEEVPACDQNGSAVTKGIEINGKLIKAFDKPLSLSCDVDGSNMFGCIEERRQFKYLGISPNLLKVYFQLIVNKSTKDDNEILREESYSYDLQSQKIMPEKPGETLQVLP